MIYYYDKRCGAAVTVIKIESSSLKMILYVADWFPNTQAKLNRLLNIMKDYDDDGILPDVLSRLFDDLKDPNMFKFRPNSEKDTFKRMLKKNLINIVEFGGKL